MGFCTGVHAVKVILHGCEIVPLDSEPNSTSNGVHPVASDNTKPSEGKVAVKGEPGSSNLSGSGLSGSLSKQHDEQVAEPPIKRRKRHRRKHFQNQEPCLMRGVYFKNMKWQAAIKVDKKQIHLGTVGSQEEAARLYDRAAFMCGREPNFELPEEEKQELRQFKWAEFLAMTRHAITHKKHRRRVGAEPEKNSEPLPLENDDDDSDPKQEDDDLSGSEDVEPDSPVS